MSVDWSQVSLPGFVECLTCVQDYTTWILFGHRWKMTVVSPNAESWFILSVSVIWRLACLKWWLIMPAFLFSHWCFSFISFWLLFSLGTCEFLSDDVLSRQTLSAEVQQRYRCRRVSRLFPNHLVRFCGQRNNWTLVHLKGCKCTGLDKKEFLFLHFCWKSLSHLIY